jgi:hypothetical protein
MWRHAPSCGSFLDVDKFVRRSFEAVRNPPTLFPNRGVSNAANKIVFPGWMDGWMDVFPRGFLFHLLIFFSFFVITSPNFPTSTFFAVSELQL